MPSLAPPPDDQASDPATDLARELDALLPQTQCTRCGYPGCRPYAEAMARGEADIDRCPPGGLETLGRLAARLGVPRRALNPDCGVEGPARVAVIDELRCIGCALCLPPCPVDAIVGAKRYLHAVLTELCTGCELCIAPCPVDCIAMVPLASLRPGALPPAADVNRRRFAAHGTRLARRQAEREALFAERKGRAARPAAAEVPPPNGPSIGDSSTIDEPPA
jgi:electron transport complex protein RnfB